MCSTTQSADRFGGEKYSVVCDTFLLDFFRTRLAGPGPPEGVSLEREETKFRGASKALFHVGTFPFVPRLVCFWLTLPSGLTELISCSTLSYPWTPIDTMPRNLHPCAGPSSCHNLLFISCKILNTNDFRWIIVSAQQAGHSASHYYHKNNASRRESSWWWSRKCVPQKGDGHAVE